MGEFFDIERQFGAEFRLPPELRLEVEERGESGNVSQIRFRQPFLLGIEHQIDQKQIAAFVIAVDDSGGNGEYVAGENPVVAATAPVQSAAAEHNDRFAEIVIMGRILLMAEKTYVEWHPLEHFCFVVKQHFRTDAFSGSDIHGV
ncbi:hypothetical protein SDC9_68458 [bioreactor metagenome]|uniref:Uncharacterized protein n=1 Tax=bioreactor metagenome TaxID=1076179 RepID=A0A644Y1W2_9ZZZZ